MKVGPRHGALRRDRRAERREAAACARAARSSACGPGHELARQRVVEAVEAEDDRPRRPVARWRPPQRQRRRDERRQTTSSGDTARQRVTRGVSTSSPARAAGPSMCGGGSMPNRRSAVGAMSIEAGRSVVDRAVAEQHAGHEARIDAVIAAPCLDVVLEHRPGDDAGGAVPRRAIAGVVADEQVGPVFEVRPGVERAVSNASRMPTSPVARRAGLSACPRSRP